MISLAAVSKSFGRQALLTDASLQLDPGDRVGLVGPNGAGKSTLFRMIVGEDTPASTQVTVSSRRRGPTSQSTSRSSDFRWPQCLGTIQIDQARTP
ncbi:MAG: ATP-binding cassette domain-containing protein [Planctomycetota bacterium]